MWRMLGVAILVCPAIGCSGSTTTPSPTCPTLHGEISNPAHNVAPAPGVSNPPVLMHATADVCAANITFTIQLASGTLDRPTTRVAVLLDTDQNPSTGILEAPGLGADYSLDLDASSGQTAIL
jgi:hypothetical protein